MSIRLDPRRLGALKRLAGDAGVRPGDLVRQWVEERIDAERTGTGVPSLEERITALEERIAGLEGSAPERPGAQQEAAAPADDETPAHEAAGAERGAADTEHEAAAVHEPEPEPEREADKAERPARSTARPRRVSAAPSPRVALHDEMTAILAERGPMTAADLAAAIVERGRYAPPRSGKPLDAAMVSQRASNPTYRSRFRRAEGRLGLADAE